MDLANDIGITYQRDGFVLVPRVFSAAEVRALRDATHEFTERSRRLGRVLKSTGGECVPVGDILGAPGLGHLVFDDRLLAIARPLVDSQELVYFGDSSVMVGGTNRGFHKDNTCRDDATHPDWQTPYSLVRFGIYLEDHDRWSGGLKVRRGSHLHVDDTSGPIEDVPSRAGDVVAWNLRTTHSGHTVRVRGLPLLPLQPRFEVRTPAFLHVPESEQRMAIFMTFGRDDQHLRRWIEKHSDLTSFPNNYVYKSWVHSACGPDYEARGAAVGLRFLRPVEDYGSQYASDVPTEGGFVAVQGGKADVYPPRGVEAVIRAVGRATRTLKSQLLRKT